MEIIKSNEYEEVSVILKVGEDFHTYDLYNFMGTKNLSINAESLKRIAKRNGFDQWAWSGHYNESTAEVKASFLKAL